MKKTKTTPNSMHNNSSLREAIPFDIKDFNPKCEYFALIKNDTKTCSYDLYSIGASRNVTVYREGFLNPQVAKEFLSALSERLYYFKEHPPVLVTMTDLKRIASFPDFAKQKSLDDQFIVAKKTSCWKKKSATAKPQEYKSVTHEHL